MINLFCIIYLPHKILFKINLNKMKKTILSTLIIFSLLFISCSDNSSNIPVNPAVIAQTTYKFERNGNTTVSYSGQTTRIKMAEELISALKDRMSTEAQLDGMFAHVEGNSDFTDKELNTSSKNIRSKTAASGDYFFTNTTEANIIKERFDAWIQEQVDEVFPNWEEFAEEGRAGQIQEADSESIYYINAKGLELNQAINKGLVGALMVDQMLNNYLGINVLDEGTNIADNDANRVVAGKNYTAMEHKWDEAFGYLYGADNAENPQYNADRFLNKYVFKVEIDTDFEGIAKEIYDAFKLGRSAIVAKNYTIRDEQTKIIRDAVSKVIAVSAVYYLQQGKAKLSVDKAAAFHDLSESFGFIQSLRFTRNTSSDTSYFTAEEIKEFIDSLMEGNGFWDATVNKLDEISDKIADKFDFTVAQAAN